MTPFIERDAINRRTVSMWDECGMRFRSNVVEPGGRIELHSHSYSHVAAIHGRFMLSLIAPDGVSVVVREANKKETIEAGWQHAFEYLGTDDVGEVLCFWPIGADQ